MKKIQNKSWDVKRKILGNDGKPEIKETKEDLVDALNALLKMRDQAQMPKGIEAFRTFSRLVNAFDKAKENGTLELEEADYSFLKRIVENDLPYAWAVNPKILDAFEGFMEA